MADSALRLGLFIRLGSLGHMHIAPGIRTPTGTLPSTTKSVIDDRGAKYHLPRIDADWSTLRLPEPKPVWPIGATYGKEHPSRPPGRLILDDLRFFLERYRDKPVSLYSLEAARADALQHCEVVLCRSRSTC